MIGFRSLRRGSRVVGLFGVISSPSACAGSSSIRMAPRRHSVGIRRRVLAEGARLVAVAVVVGLAGAAFSARFLEGSSMVSAPSTFPPTPRLRASSVVALLACWVPASRATRVDPAKALKAE
jgi:hypothetical protein